MEVRRVNGERVENLRHMKSLVECSKDSHWIEHAATTRFFFCICTRLMRLMRV